MGAYRKPSKLFCMKGISDILGVIKNKNGCGIFVSIEVKTPISYKHVLIVQQKVLTVGDLKLFKPQSKAEHHIYNQILFLSEIKKNGGLGFFTYGAEHTLKKLNEIV